MVNKPTKKAVAKTSDTTENSVEAAKKRHLVVAIGASAGGLEAMKELTANLPRQGQISYIVAQHLSPKHKSILIDLLAQGTDLRVVEPEKERPLEPGTIYVTPPNFDIEHDGSALRLVKPESSVGPTPSVNHLFKSLADNLGHDCVALVLSGTGSDGAEGVRAIRAAGGVVIAQDPQTAKFDGMPNAAIQTQCVDLIKAPKEMGLVISGLLENASLDAGDSLENSAVADLHRVFACVRRATGMDLEHYKSGTVQRRVQRRINLAGVADLEAYADLCERQSNEAELLTRDIIISVTGFFRDGGAFKGLERVLSDMVKAKKNTDVLRVWICGCASGEEAYSLAIILSEIVDRQKDSPNFVIFASDIDEVAIERARVGVYSASSVDAISPDRVARYFEQTETGYRVRSILRQKIVFAVQDVISDPPFSQMDVVTCRNLLIYFNRPVQEQVLKTFHYSLNEGGALFLGGSESASCEPELFAPLVKSHRIFQPIRVPGGVNYGPRLRGLKRTDPLNTPEKEAAPKKVSRSELELYGGLVNAVCPPGIVVDESDRVRHFVGDVSQFIRFPVGVANLNIFELMPDELRADIRAMLFRCRRDGSETIGGHYVLSEGDKPVSIRVAPFKMGLITCVFVGFERKDKVYDITSLSDDARDSVVLGALEAELSSTRQHLQTVVEELETSNEELQSQSEELQSANEELQSTNEELQTSNEELQSTNEELITVNEELQTKSSELENTAGTLSSVLSSMVSPLVVVDKNLKVINHNEPAQALVNTDAFDGAVLSVLPWAFDSEAMSAAVNRVLKNRRTENLRIDADDKIYSLSVAPSIDGFDRVIGVVLVFVDLTDMQQARDATLKALGEVREERERFSVTLSSIQDGVITVDADNQVIYMNARAELLTGWRLSEALGMHSEKVLRVIAAKRIKPAVPLLAQVLSSGQGASRTGFQLMSLNSLEDSPGLSIEEVASPIYDADARLTGAVMVFRDMSDIDAQRVQLEYQASHDALTGLLNREVFEQEVHLAINVAQNGSGPHLLGYIDLDRFKHVNDTAGHASGDAVLRNVAMLLRAHLRTGDILARIGGDEFAFLIKNCDLERGKDAAHKLISAVAQYRFEFASKQFSVGASVGLVQIDRTSAGFDGLMRMADLAVYQAKRYGGGRFEVADASDVSLQERDRDNEIMLQVLGSLESGAFRLVYQNVYEANDSASSDPVYREVLCRLIAPSGEEIPPNDFVRVGESYDLMLRIDRFIVRNALEVIQERAGEDQAVWAINLSADSISDPRFLDFMLAQLERLDIPRHRLCIEITETAAIRQLAAAVKMINTLRKLGVLFALDDFGSGMSSFGYLKNLPVDYLKIDGGFITQLINNSVDQSLVEAMIKVGKDLDLMVVAESVENQEAVLKCRELGVDLLQGYGLHRPELLLEALPKPKA